MKLAFILIIGTLFVCLSFGSALSEVTTTQYPGPNVKYVTLDGEKYWNIFGWFSF